MEQTLSKKKIDLDKLISYIEFNTTKEELFFIKEQIHRISKKYKEKVNLLSNVITDQTYSAFTSAKDINDVLHLIENDEEFVTNFTCSNKLQCVKIIKDKANIGLKDAKNILDSMYSIYDMHKRERVSSLLTAELSKLTKINDLVKRF